MASVEKRAPRTKGGKASYRVRYRDPSGRQRNRSFDKKRDADRFAAEVETDKARGRYVDSSLGRVTLGEYAEQWLSIQTFKATTRQSTEQRLRSHILPTLGSTPLAQIKPSQIQAWVKSKSGVLAESTVKQLHATLSSALKAAVADGCIATNPAASDVVRLPKRPQRRVVPLTDAQVLAMSHALPDRYALMLTLGVGLGLRQGEVFALALDDIDFMRGIVTVQRQVCIVESRQAFSAPKNGRSREVPLPSYVANQINLHMKTWSPRSVTLPWDAPGGRPVSADLLITSREGKALNRNYVNSHIWRPARVAAGLADGRENGMHAARHFYASSLLHGGTSVRTVSEYLGHADPGFTLRTYTHLMPDAEDATKRVVDGVFERLESAGNDPLRVPDVSQDGV